MNIDKVINAKNEIAVYEQGEDCRERLRRTPEINTPSRKISSSRIINAFSQFYNGSMINSTNEEGDGVSPSGRTPTRGMETKLMSMWHNVKYGWSGKIRSNFSKEQPIWLLGRCYHRKSTPNSSMENSAEFSNQIENRTNDGGPEETVIQEFGMDVMESENSENPWEEGIEGFRKDFFSRLWMTYRREFQTMNGSDYTSDCGWGCMLRSGQMLLAQGLVCHFLGRSWRWDPETQINTTYEDHMHRKIIRWFGDSSSKNNPFSIHTLCSLGQEMGKKPGDWYGPSSVSHLLRQAVDQARQENADFDNLVLYVAKDCTIYIQDVLDQCLVPDKHVYPNVPWQTSKNNFPAKNVASSSSNASQLHWKSLIILVPLRLGAEKLNAVYAHCLKLLLSVEHCIGIIGGRPKHSLYFIGFQEDKMIHLDPHYCQEVVDVSQDNFPANSFHCKSPRKLKASKMDPSCCVGFYCQTKSDFDNFITSVQPYLHPFRFASNIERLQTDENSIPNSIDVNYPIFSFSKGKSCEQEKNSPPESVYKPLQEQLAQLRLELCTDDDDNDETEEFVIL
ncbi:cysteine protease ATG4C [Condylostylus longicornis]|uniref:cysteine protease ATG4C n=1 Tax=Condylostylus longicornis TaxID=2530218 RepID=UPI00244DFE97|nr:cysteine protease ATG4C [Condylostylus longicornis]